ncbi:hypothetical protein QAD02_020885 [Eretmocerus hayati]|uniref:Uncharacterized protein n=1 Tax=Eretmocerus hayati TaxID=131215 RepID=A0ACC2PRW0_9HYME|nr:hypothetical protein QAD02_020885 [Eretmocerus hayati]
MMKTPKSKFMDRFTPLAGKPNIPGLTSFLDRGFLLHGVVWSSNELVGEVLKKYVTYDALNYSRDLFLKNEKNKDGLIHLIMSELGAAGYVCKQASEDADVLIVTTAIELWRDMKTPTLSYAIVGEDTDLPIFLTQLTDPDNQVLFSKPDRGKTPHKYYSCGSFEPSCIRSVVAFLHAFSECDTVSAMLGKGKVIVKLFGKMPKFHLQKSSITEMAKTTKLTFGLEHLPPTTKAVKQHILRAYFQIQLWLGKKLIEATDFGWFKSITSSGVRRLEPIYVVDNILIPPKLMEQISCGCKKGCAKCSCVRAGMPCTDLCKYCHGTDCENVNHFPIEVPTDVQH